MNMESTTREKFGNRKHRDMESSIMNPRGTSTRANGFRISRMGEGSKFGKEYLSTAGSLFEGRRAVKELIKKLANLCMKVR